MEVSAKTGTGGMPGEQWEHWDKRAWDERNEEDAPVLMKRENDGDDCV